MCAFHFIYIRQWALSKVNSSENCRCTIRSTYHMLTGNGFKKITALCCTMLHLSLGIGIHFKRLLIKTTSQLFFIHYLIYLLLNFCWGFSVSFSFILFVPFVYTILNILNFNVSKHTQSANKQPKNDERWMKIFVVSKFKITHIHKHTHTHGNYISDRSEKNKSRTWLTHKHMQIEREKGQLLCFRNWILSWFILKMSSNMKWRWKWKIALGNGFLP